MDPIRRLRWATFGLATIVLIGTIGYVVLDFGVLDAFYQTVTTVTTVGFREVQPLDTTGKLFTIVLILVGVGFAFYTFGTLLEVLVEGRLTSVGRRRHMDTTISKLRDHIVVCGWGRVGRAIANDIASAGERVVVVDIDESRLEGIGHLHIVGDATKDDVLRAAGIDRARALVAAIDTDAENLYVTLSGRAVAPDLFIVARTRDDESQSKLLRAGANRVVNPQSIGGSRMAAFVLQPHVAEFLDVVMHDGTFEFHLEEVAVPPGSPLEGITLADADLRRRTGALLLALRGADGRFEPNPPLERTITAGDVLIAVGAEDQLRTLNRHAAPT